MPPVIPEMKIRLDTMRKPSLEMQWAQGRLENAPGRG
jgi:hypothetical protein